MKSIIQVFSFDMLSKILMGVVGIMLIRFMPEAEYANYILALSAAMVIGQAFAPSFNRIYIVGYERLSTKVSLSSFLGFQLWALFIVLIMLLPLRNYLGKASWLVAPLTIATCLSDFSKTYFQRDLKFFRFSMVEMGRVSLFACVIILLIGIVRYEMRAWQVLLAQAITMAAVSVIVFFKHFNWKEFFEINAPFNLALDILKGQYRYLLGYFFVLAFFSQIDIFMLKALSGKTALATYGSSFRYYSLLSLALNAVNAVLLPLIQDVTNPEELDTILKGHCKMLLIFAPIVLLGAWASYWIIPWIDMGKYPGSVGVFRILAISTIISFAFSPYVNLLMRFEDFKFLFLLVCTGVLTSIGLDYLLIPMCGAIGAAWSTFFSFGLVNFSIFLRAKSYRRLSTSGLAYEV